MNHISKVVSFPARKSISRFTPLYQISYIKLYNHEIPWHPIKSPRKQMKSPLNDHVTVPVRWWWTGQDFPQQQGWPFTPSWCIQRRPWSISWWRWDTLCFDVGPSHCVVMIKVDPVQDPSQWSQAVLCSTGLAAAFFAALAMLCYSFLVVALERSWSQLGVLLGWLQQVGYILHSKKEWSLKFNMCRLMHIYI